MILQIYLFLFMELYTISCDSFQPKLLCISFDGFRYDYLEKAERNSINISSFKRIWNSGFRVSSIKNEFVTRTGPNHLSLVTGLHEESHGIIENIFFDPNLNETYSLSNGSQSNDSKWYDVGGEPIWITNQRHGHQSAVTFWPGGLARIKGQLPTYHFPKYDGKMTLRNRIDKVMEWLQIPDVTLALLYYHEPDAQGHLTGPDSLELLMEIGKINRELDYLLNRIDAIPFLKASLNIIVTSDHGMSNVSPERSIFLDDYLNESMYFSPGLNGRIMWLLWPKEGYTATYLYQRLINKHDKMNVYLKDQIPGYLHYSNNERISPLVVYSEPEWMILRSKQLSKSFSVKGDHGYDPTASSSMLPLFLAAGPNFKQFKSGHLVKPFNLIDIYPMMCELLQLHDPAPHNGSLSNVQYLLQNPQDNRHRWFDSTFDEFTICIVLFISVGMCMTIVCCAYLDGRLRRHLTNTTQPSRYLLKRRQHSSSHTQLLDRSIHDSNEDSLDELQLLTMNDTSGPSGAVMLNNNYKNRRVKMCIAPNQDCQVTNSDAEDVFLNMLPDTHHYS